MVPIEGASVAPEMEVTEVDGKPVYKIPETNEAYRWLAFLPVVSDGSTMPMASKDMRLWAIAYAVRYHGEVVDPFSLNPIEGCGAKVVSE